MNDRQVKEGLERLIFGKAELPPSVAVTLYKTFDAKYYRKHQNDFIAASQHGKIYHYDELESAVWQRYCKMVEYYVVKDR